MQGTARALLRGSYMYEPVAESTINKLEATPRHIKIAPRQNAQGPDGTKLAHQSDTRTSQSCPARQGNT
jgi:hypothetical protein